MKRLLVALVCCILLVGVVAADTLVLAPSNDADVQEETDQGWPAIRNDVGDFVGNNRTVYHRVNLYRESATSSGIYSFNSRASLTFDASVIPDDAYIYGGYLSLYVAGKSNAFGTTNLSVVDIKPWNKNSYIAGDYHNTSFLRYANDLNYSSVGASAYNNISLYNLSWISKTTYSTVMLAHSVDVDNGSFVWNNSLDYSGFNIRPKGYSGGAYTPYLVLSYTTPPLPLTNLTNTSPLCNSLQFNYTAPAGVGAIKLWRNNTALTNETNSSLGVLWEGLPEDTDITFSSQTCSIDGLVCNSTFVNMTARTGTCGSAPEANFTANQTSICTYDAIQFNDTSTNTPTSWHWILTGGWDSHDQNPVHVFDAAGSYTVNLTVENAYGNDTESKTNYITVTDCVYPTAQFEADYTEVCPLDTVHFTDLSTGGVNAWNWSFGDGNVSSLQGPSKMYNITGTYTVNLSVSNPSGSDNEVKTNYITVSDCAIPIPAVEETGGGSDGSVGLIAGVIGGMIGSLIFIGRKTQP